MELFQDFPHMGRSPRKTKIIYNIQILGYILHKITKVIAKLPSFYKSACRHKKKVTKHADQKFGSRDTILIKDKVSLKSVINLATKSAVYMPRLKHGITLQLCSN